MAATTQQIEPKTSLGEQIAELVREMLSEQGKIALAARVNAESSFERDLGLGSLDLVELVVRCESKLEIAVPDEVAEQADTPAGWAKAIEHGGQEAAKSVYRIVPPSEELPVAPREARTILDALRWHAAAAPDRILIHVLVNGSGAGLTGPRLLESAALIARGMTAQGIRPQDRVGLLLPPGVEFFEAFLATLMAGAVPVPLYPPGNLRQYAHYCEEQSRILRESGVVALLIPETFRILSRVLRARTAGMLGAFNLHLLRGEGRRTWVDLPGPAEATPAFIQMTSGATGPPRAAAVSHAALLANIRALGERLDLRGGDAVACCLPLASYWGLAASWLFSLYHGLPLTYLSPRDFAERPETWLWAIHNSKSTISFAPNSAYDSCARRIPLWTIEGLDLRRWRCAGIAGELARRDSLDAFAARFAAFGFQPDAMRFAYGLAEAGGVLTLSGSGRRAEPDAQGYCAVGEPLPGYDLRAAEGQIEYRPAGTQAWIGTGDLGYFRDGALVITGRVKEVLRSQGKLLSPIAIEAAANRVPGVLSGVSAAFSVHRGTGEQLVVAAEAAAEPGVDAERVVIQVRQAAQQAVGDAGLQVVLTPLGSLPRTGDGRLRRILARELYREGALTRNGANATVTRKVTWLKNLPGIARMWLRTTRRRAERQLRRWRAASAAGEAPLNAERARSVLNRLGHEAVIEGELEARTLVAVHRCGPLDPVVFVAFSRVPIRFAGDAVLIGVPRWLHASLRPLIAATEAEMLKALEQGVLIQFPDNELGEPAARSRFRLPPLRVAEAIVPSVVQQVRGTTTIRIGKAFPPSSDAVLTRESLRAALARLRQA